ncbi:TadE/TadG family type IV pilus assembly protein [Ralstonia sp. SET104]|uniref:TadE/TadG family type IV pilus assembly protein n=1 Tax=Ralstonia sp. SET104 TaxID=2448774 RepID=UPI0035B52E2E
MFLRGGRREHRRIRKAQHGVAVVEFALLLPVLLLLVFGIIEFGLAMYDKAVITNASREAARAGVVLKNPKMSTSQIQDVALNYCQNYLVTLGNSAKPTVTVPSGQGGSFGTPLTVTVSYNYSGLALGAMINPLTGPLQLSATAVMNNE